MATIRKASDQIYNLTKPTIAVIHGYTLGGGCELSMCCDLRLCSEKAKFGQPEINLGLIPGAGGTQRLSRLIGAAKAKEMIFLGDNIDAATALNLGLVNKVVPVEKLMEEATPGQRNWPARAGRYWPWPNPPSTTGWIQISIPAWKLKPNVMPSALPPTTAKRAWTLSWKNGKPFSRTNNSYIPLPRWERGYLKDSLGEGETSA